MRLLRIRRWGGRVTRWRVGWLGKNFLVPLCLMADEYSFGLSFGVVTNSKAKVGKGGLF